MLFSPGVTVEEVKADIPWNLQVADRIHSFPVPCDEEIDFLRSFSPISSFPNQVDVQLMVENFLRKLMVNDIQWVFDPGRTGPSGAGM